MKPIVLTGMSGAGKSSVGREISQILGWDFFDSDIEIEKLKDKTITEIFAQNGEGYFRKLEAQVIKSKLEPNVLISIGGGAFENETIRSFLLENSIVIYLKASKDTIFNRLKDKTDRPLLAENPQEKISQLLEIREKNYKLAHFTILTDNKTIEQVTGEVLVCAGLK